uniref:Ig-like domain-containing protein n=1 Tax=Podarcis muralis TaxID=64176 RepID=A0A670JYN6_PODMU
MTLLCCARCGRPPLHPPTVRHCSLPPLLFQHVDPSLSKPSIRMRPGDTLAEGFNVTIECHGPENGLNFSLHKSSNLIAWQMAKSDGNTSEFSLSMIRLEDEGNYTCQYHRRGHAFQWSEPSDAVGLELVTGQLYRKPSISVRPSPQVILGEDFYIHCETENNSEATFYLVKEGSSEAEENRNATKFFFSEVRLEDGGSYTCRYHRIGFPFRWSESSDPMELVVTDPWFSKPSITLTPTQQISTGMNVSIECQGAESYLTFSLFKSNNLIASQEAEENRNATKFFFSEVRLEDGGSYTCRYHRIGFPFRWSESSDPMELVVTGQYPEPSISVIPSPNVALGGNFYISCGSHHYKATFELFKGEPAIYVRSEKSSSYTVDFFISEAKLEHGGIYQCRYCLNRLCSHLSDRLYINVTGEGLSYLQWRVHSNPTPIGSAPLIGHLCCAACLSLTRLTSHLCSLPTNLLSNGLKAAYRYSHSELHVVFYAPQ